MMDHMKLTDELRQQLIEAAAWGKADITPTERLDERGGKKGDEKGSGKKKGHHGRGPKRKETAKEEGELDYEESAEHEDAEDAEELEEAIHVCPLCTSQLDESIDEERILEHLNVVMGLVDRLSQLNEGDEDIDAVIDETLADLLLQTEEEE
jgi:hypothetical protein